MHLPIPSSYFVLHPYVPAALQADQTVVSFESTIIEHGMPDTDNLTTAHQLEQIVLNNGVIPTTTADIHGRPHISLSSDQLYLLAKYSDVRKRALHDLRIPHSEAFHGAITVSATMHLAHRANIPFFATGDTGGSPRGVISTFHISPDSPALACFPVHKSVIPSSFHSPTSPSSHSPTVPPPPMLPQQHPRQASQQLSSGVYSRPYLRSDHSSINLPASPQLSPSARAAAKVAPYIDRVCLHEGTKVRGGWKFTAYCK